MPNHSQSRMCARVLLSILVLISSSLAQELLPIPATSALISFPVQLARPGSSIIAPVQFTSNGQRVSALQFDLGYDSTIFQISAGVADSLRSEQKKMHIQDVDPNRKRILILGQNGNVIPDGALLRLIISVKPQATIGFSNLNFFLPVASDPYALDLPITVLPSFVTIQPGTGTSILSDGIVNAASMISGPLAPGELIAIYGSSIGPADTVRWDGVTAGTVLGETRVLFNGIPAPVLFAEFNQIQAVVPYGVAGSEELKLELEQRGEILTSLQLPASDVMPGLFTEDGSGTGQAALLNEDDSPNSPLNPAARGSIVMLFATGSGDTDPPASDDNLHNQPSAPRLPVLVRIGGIPAEVISANASRQLSAITHIRCRIPDGIDPGISVPIEIEIGNRISQAGVTISVN